LLATHEFVRDNGSYFLTDAGIFALFKAEGARVDKAIKVFAATWNLRADDLEKQSDETISFLYELLS
jgi:hypothetical protein